LGNRPGAGTGTGSSRIHPGVPVGSLVSIKTFSDFSL
jgi:hypothetical protein